MGKNHHTRAQSLLHGSSNLLPVLGPALALGFLQEEQGEGGLMEVEGRGKIGSNLKAS